MVILAIVVIRYTWRKTTRLPDWSTGLADWEKKLIHWYEKRFYWAMFLMPLSGYLFVESGGFGVQFFGVTRLPVSYPTTKPSPGLDTPSTSSPATPSSSSSPCILAW